MAISEEVRKEYFNALYNSQFGNNEPMKRFRSAYPSEYALINGVYHKRVKLMKSFEVLNDISSNNVYWGSLTYNDIKDKNCIRVKRQEAQRHLNQLFSLWIMVEENGSLNGRYHIHFIGVFRDGKTFEDFFKWHSRTDIQKVVNCKKISRYLCDYVSKQVPRIRRSKNLIKCEFIYKEARKCYPFECFVEEKKKEARDFIFADNLCY